MTVDLTTITTPFGLLDKKTQEALKAHGGPYEVWLGLEWGPPYSKHPSEFDRSFAYRVKPAPPKPREFWICGESNHSTLADAKAWARRMNCEHLEIIHVIEKSPK